MPWYELRHGPAPADRTLLLDYLSPITATVLWRAAKNRHWCIVTTIGGNLLLLLATVFSTGLLAVESTPIVENNVALLSFQFDASDYSLDNVGAEALSVVYATRFQDLAYPLGTTSDVVVPTFEPTIEDLITPLDSEAYTTHATILGVAPSFTCEAVDIQTGPAEARQWKTMDQYYFIGNVRTTSCNITNAIVGQGPLRDFDKVPEARQNYQGWIRNVVCNKFDYSYPERGAFPFNSTDFYVKNATADNAVLVTVADIRYDSYNTSLGLMGAINLRTENVTAILCKPSYSVNKYNVSYSGVLSRRPFTLELAEETSDLISGFPFGHLGAAIQLSSKLLYLGPGGADYRKNFVYEVPTLFQMMKRLNGNASIGTLMDSAILASASTTLFNSISTQLIQQMLVKPNNGTTIIGSKNSVQSRLRDQPVATGVLCTVFALMAGISTALMFIRPWNVATREPGSVLATAELLASSPDLQNILTGLGYAPTSRAREALDGWLFVTYTYSGTTLSGVQATVCSAKITQESQGVVPDTAITWWRPFASRS
jgi:hypothetical protein